MNGSGTCVCFWRGVCVTEDRSFSTAAYTVRYSKSGKKMRLLDHKCCNKMALRCVFILIYVFYVRMCGGVMVVVFREGYKKQKGGGGGRGSPLLLHRVNMTNEPHVWHD